MDEQGSLDVHRLLTDRKGLFRFVFVLAVAGMFASFFTQLAPSVLGSLYQAIGQVIDRFGGHASEHPSFHTDALGTTGFALLGALLGAFVGVRVVRGLQALVDRWDSMESGDKLTLFLGVFAGLIASVPALQIFQALDISGQARSLLFTGVVVGLSALAVYLMQTMADFLPWKTTRNKAKKSGLKLLDTNVIIDGRIYDVAKTGFLDGQIYVPGFVLDELQYIADSHDGLRRQRGRRGLDVLKHMQAEFSLEVRIHDKLAPEQGDGVDSRLVRLARALGADIVTNDFNLNRVAALQEVKVMNLNDLALALRPNVLPTENLELHISREGNQYGQGVGYLDDGTMVVVENGKPHIGETMDVVVTQVIQTERGKMIFAEVPTEAETSAMSRRRPASRRQQA